MIDDCAIKPIYVLDQKLKNVTVEILKNQLTGEYSIGWSRQENTEDITESEED